MFKKIGLTFILTLLLSTTYIFAQDGPKAVIDAKPEANIGESVWLKPTGSVGQTFTWKILPPEAEKSFVVLPIFGGLDADGKPTIHYWAQFSSMEPQTVYFILVAVENNIIDVATHKLIYGGGDVVIPTPDQIPDLAPPDANLATLVQPIITILSSGNVQDLPKDSRNIQSFYWDMADTLERDKSSQIVKNTDQLRQLNVAAGTLMFQQTGMQNKYVGLAAAIDKALSTTIGLDIVDLNSAKRQDAINVLKAISWAAQEARQSIKK
jgi:hypothetical protein